MCDHEMLFEYGLVGAFDTVALMRGEEVAIISNVRVSCGEGEDEGDHGAENGAEDEDEDDKQNIEGEEESIPDHDTLSTSNDKEFEGITYLELQYSSQALAALLFHRLGVRLGDSVAIVCKGHVAAEITSCLACARIGAPFVPLDLSWLHKNPTKVQALISQAAVVAAVVVGLNDSDDAIELLAACKVFRCALLSEDGSLRREEAHAEDYRDDLPVCPHTPIGGSGNEADDPDDSDHCDNATASSSPPLYIMFTSGSTGGPKGVRGTHAGLINRLAWQYKTFPWARGEVCLRRTSLSFVDSLAEMFAPLLAAVPVWSPTHAPLIATTDSGLEENKHVILGDLLSLAPAASLVGVTRVTLLPSQLALALQLNCSFGEAWPSLRLIIVSGEACRYSLVQQCRRYLPHVTLVNLYGSTEVAGDVSYAILSSPEDPQNLLQAHDVHSSTADDKGIAPIGVAVDGNELFVATESQSDNADGDLVFLQCADGVPGELLISGVHVADGYHNNVILSAERFIPRVIIFGQTRVDSDEKERIERNNVFRSGDWVVRDPDTQQLTWLGRRDDQVKIRGVRVEVDDVLMSIKSVLGVSRGVAVCAVDLNNLVASDAEISGLLTSSDRSLVLFFEVSELAAAGAQIDPNFLRVQLMEHLPSAFVPSLILPLFTPLPETVAGKIDRPSLVQMLKDNLKSHTHRVPQPSNITARSEECMAAKMPRLDHAADGSACLDLELRSDQVIMFELLREILHFDWKLGTGVGTGTGTGIGTGVGTGVVGIGASEASGTIDENGRIFLSQATFFSLGGDSMLAIQFIWLIQKRTDRVVSLKQLNDQNLLDLILNATEWTGTNAAPSSSAHLPLHTSNPTQQHMRVSIPEEDRSALTHLRDLIDHAESVTVWSRAYSTESAVSSIDAASPLINSCALAMKWSVPLKKCVDSSVLAISYHSKSNGEFASVGFIGSHGGDVVAIDMTSGTRLWSAELGVHIEGSAHCSVDGKLVFIPAFIANDVDLDMPYQRAQEEGMDGVIFALSTHSGELRWRQSVPGQLKSQVLVHSDSGTLFVGAYDGFVYRFNCNDGAELGRVYCGGGSIYASPVLSPDAQRIISVSTAGKVSAFLIRDWLLAADGRGTAAVIFEAESPVFGTPIVQAGPFPRPADMEVVDEATMSRDRITFGCVDGTLKCVSLATATESVSSPSSSCSLVWQSYATRPIFSSPLLFAPSADDVRIIFGSHDGFVRCVESVSGSLLWETDMGSVLFASLSVATVDKCHIVVSASTAGIVTVMNALDGSVIASTRLPGEIYSTPVLWPSDNTRAKYSVLLGCRDDNVYCFEIDISCN